MIALTLLALAYFLPSIVALCRRHHNAGAIIIVNFLFGWTGLGWLWALVWCAMNPPPAPVVMVGGAAVSAVAPATK